MRGLGKLPGVAWFSGKRGSKNFTASTDARTQEAKQNKTNREGTLLVEEGNSQQVLQIMPNYLNTRANERDLKHIVLKETVSKSTI